MILDTTQKEGNINVLHGLRFISMTWVILGHTFIFGAAYIGTMKIHTRSNSLTHEHTMISTTSHDFLVA